jgi:hypothetical protein
MGSHTERSGHTAGHICNVLKALSQGKRTVIGCAQALICVSFLSTWFPFEVTSRSKYRWHTIRWASTCLDTAQCSSRGEGAEKLQISRDVIQELSLRTGLDASRGIGRTLNLDTATLAEQLLHIHGLS